jgi:hypothetical protein
MGFEADRAKRPAAAKDFEMHLTTSNQQPAISNQQPATSNQQPATSNQQPATSNQQPATSNQQLPYADYICGDDRRDD